jgi:hypothetical protein
VDSFGGGVRWDLGGCILLGDGTEFDTDSLPILVYSARTPSPPAVTAAAAVVRPT